MGSLIPDTLVRGVDLYKSGQLDSAARLFREALSAEPNNLVALNLLGVITAQQGQLDQAIELLQRAVQAHPNAAEGYNNLGMALNLGKRFAQAVPVLEKAATLNPTYAQAHNNLGVAQQGMGNRERAVVCFQRACALKPDYVESLNNLGAALHVLKQHGKAVEVLTRALAFNSRFAEAHSNLGAALLALDKSDAALNACKQAIELAPKNAQAHAHLGTVYLALGKFADARQSFESAVQLSPENPTFYYELMSCYTVTDSSDPHLAAMEKLHKRIGLLSDDAAIELQFAMAKAYTDIGADEQAFGHLIAGNAHKRRTIKYDEATAIAWIDRIREIFSADLMRKMNGSGIESSKPIFIVGMMRSGSTLVEQILASHPAVAAAGERPYFRDAYERARQEIRTRLPFPEFSMQLDERHLKSLGGYYLALLEQTVSSDYALRVTDKMLSNFATVGLIHLALPNARIIHTCRDPIITCLSAYSKLFSDEQPFTYDLGELGRYYAAYRRLMTHWHNVLPPGVLLDVHYESLMADFEVEARRMVEHCGLIWDERCLAFHETQRAVRTASATQVRKPIYKSSTGRWMPSQELLAPLLAALKEI